MCQVTVVVYHLRGSVEARPTAFRAGCGDVRSSFGVQNGSFLSRLSSSGFHFSSDKWWMPSRNHMCVAVCFTEHTQHYADVHRMERKKSKMNKQMNKIPRQPPRCTFAGIQRPTCHSAVLDTLHDILCAAFKWIQADAFHFFSLWVGLKLQFLL